VLWSDPAYRADVEAVLEVAAQRHVAVQTIKSLARRRWSDPTEPHHHSWYEPLADPVAASRSIRWVLSHPGVFLNSSSDAALLRLTLEAAQAAEGLDAPREADLDADVATQGIEALFDGDRLERI